MNSKLRLKIFNSFLILFTFFQSANAQNKSYRDSIIAYQQNNPYCAYTTGYNCPIPPKENLLTVPIAAGEKSYGKPFH